MNTNLILFVMFIIVVVFFIWFFMFNEDIKQKEEIITDLRNRLEQAYADIMKLNKERENMNKEIKILRSKLLEVVENECSK